MENDPDEEEMGDVNIDDERERHFRNVFKDNEGGVDDKKALIHAKRWDSYVNKEEQLVKGTSLFDEERVNFVQPKKIVIKTTQKTTQKIETVRY